MALHSLHVVDLMQRRDPTIPHKYLLAGLLHDASEAYLGDVTSPLKRLIGPRYGELEDLFQEAVIQAFGLEPDAFCESAPLWAADREMAWIESQQILTPEASATIKPLFVGVHATPTLRIPRPPLEPSTVAEAFVRAYEALKRGESWGGGRWALKGA